jgi:adenylylsulfate kinase-like enzyme
MIIWLCGASGSGKTTLATYLAEILNAPIVDADVYRKKWSDLGYSKDDRMESCDNLLYEASALQARNSFVIVCAIAPYKEWRDNQHFVKFIQVSHEGAKRRDDDVLFEDIKGLTFNITL